MTLLPAKAQRPPFQNMQQLTLWAYASMYLAASPTPAIAAVPARPASGGNPAVPPVPPVPPKPGVPTFLANCTFQVDNGSVSLGFKFPTDQATLVAGMSGLNPIAQIKPITATAVSAPTVNYPISGNYAIADEPSWCNSLERFLAWGAYHCKSTMSITAGMLAFQVTLNAADLGGIDLLLAALPASNTTTTTLSASGQPSLVAAVFPRVAHFHTRLGEIIPNAASAAGNTKIVGGGDGCVSLEPPAVGVAVKLETWLAAGNYNLTIQRIRNRYMGKLKAEIVTSTGNTLLFDDCDNYADVADNDNNTPYQKVVTIPADGYQNILLTVIEGTPGRLNNYINIGFWKFAPAA